jgi:hypothetical protein
MKVKGSQATFGQGTPADQQKQTKKAGWISSEEDQLSSLKQLPEVQ